MAVARISLFSERAEHFLNESKKSEKRARSVSLLRISTFTVFLIVAVYAANQRDLFLLGLSTVIFVILFGVLVNIHDRVRYYTRHFGFLSKINNEEISRIKGKLEPFDGGTYFLEDKHPYHDDLDIFGKNSLFQLLNRTTTFRGRKILADWISGPAGREEILNRQEAVHELSGNIDWMQEFEATGRHSGVHEDTGRFLNWLGTGSLLLGNLFYNLVRFIAPAIILIILAGVVIKGFSLIWIISAITFNIAVIFSAADKIREIHESTSASINSLQSFEALIGMVEKREFKTGMLQEIAGTFKPGEVPASQTIRRLRKILHQLDNRDNMIYHLFNAILLFDLHYAIAAEKWKRDQPEDIRNWFQKLGEMEALNSMAGFHHANPGYCFPEISTGRQTFYAENLGHPLIPVRVRVNNNFSFDGKGTIVLITGSNMSGKSTFLRTVGINAVLALAGAPVCAGKFSVSAFRVFTGMRSRDNLEESISGFYAELKRIRQLIDYIPGEIPVLFLLDEILKGTNSIDRHLGAVSLVHQLSGENTSGMISTHDLDLARQTMQNSYVQNFSFESSIRGEEIIFDYKLRPGICETFNASTLMEKMGIRLIK